MAKSKTANRVISKQELLTPRMEFLPLGDDAGGVYVRELGGKSLLAYNEAIREAERKYGKEVTEEQALELMETLVLMTACNEDGSRFFADMEEVGRLAENSLVTLKLIADKAMEVSGIGEDKNNLKNDPNSSSTDI